VLDREYLGGLGCWDIVYSWGVLHHTGDMWTALRNVMGLVRPDGTLFISIYNDQGDRSRRWRAIKAFYNKGRIPRWLVLGSFIPAYVLHSAVKDLLLLRNPLRRYSDYKRRRGMSIFHDWVDWLGGYPFEVAKPEEIIDFYLEKGFALDRLKTVGGAVG